MMTEIRSAIYYRSRIEHKGVYTTGSNGN